MSQNRKRKFSINGKQPSEFGMNEEQQGEYNMKGKFDMNRMRTNRTIENQQRETVASPKDLRAAHSRKDPKKRLCRSVGVQAAEKGFDKETLKNLDGLRSRLGAEIVEYRWVSGYLDRKEKQLLLKNIKMENSSKLFKDQWFTCGKWSQRVGVGDIIAFNARIKDGKLQYPTNVTLIKPESNKFSSGGRGTSEGVQTELPF